MERNEYSEPASNCSHGRSSLSIAPCTHNFGSRALANNAIVRTSASGSRVMSSSMNNTCVAQPCLRSSIRPRAKPPAPPRLPFGTTCNGAPVGASNVTFCALSTTNTRTRPRNTSILRSSSNTLLTVLRTYSWRLNVVIDSDNFTSWPGASALTHSPPVMHTSPPCASTRTK